MSRRIDPKLFGLPSRTLIEEVEPDTLALVLHRKSRIIMADGRKILEKAYRIRATRPTTKIILQTTAPVCSKTRKFLADNEIDIVLFE